MLLSNVASVTVPAGHYVTLYRMEASPRGVRAGSGLVLAHFGPGGDDPDEIDAIFTEALECARATPNAIHFARDAYALSDLFMPAKPSLLDAQGAIAWTVREDGLAAIRDGANVDALVARFERVALAQWLVV